MAVGVDARHVALYPVPTGFYIKEKDMKEKKFQNEITATHTATHTGCSVKHQAAVQ
jgi:hypothetical protein